MRRLQIGVIGTAGAETYPKGYEPEEELLKTAEEVGRLLATKDVVIITGGEKGAMESVSKGAKAAGGIVVGVVSGDKRNVSNPYTDIEVITGMTHVGAEHMQALMCDGIVVIGGGAGTLQIITVAYQNQIPIVVFKQFSGWGKNLAELDEHYLDARKKVKIVTVSDPKEASETILKLVASSK